MSEEQSQKFRTDDVSQPPSPDSRELKQWRRRKATKTSLKNLILTASKVIMLFHLVQFAKCWQFFLELNSKILYRSSGKEKESCCLVLTSSAKHEIKYYHIVVVQWWQRNAQKPVAHAELLFYQTEPIAFLPVSLTSLSLLLKLHRLKNWKTCGPQSYPNQ